MLKAALNQTMWDPPLVSGGTSGLMPPPLVLKPGHRAQLAASGHRSHSSHRYEAVTARTSQGAVTRPFGFSQGIGSGIRSSRDDLRKHSAADPRTRLTRRESG